MQLQGKQKNWILVVDDEPEIRSTLTEIINVTFGDKARVIEAKDGLEATSKINCQMFDCIVTDLMMPKKEGSAFIASVRQNNFNESTPIIVLSGSDHGKSIENDFEFIYYVPKPCNFGSMGDLIKTQLKMGDAKKRLSAEMMNNIISSSVSFIQSATNETETQQRGITAKKAGEELQGFSASTIEIGTGTVKNHFSILLSDQSISNIKEQFLNFSEKTNEDIVRSLAFVILRKTLSISKIKSNGSFSKSQLLEGTKLLTQKSGLIIDVGNELLNFKIFASVK